MASSTDLRTAMDNASKLQGRFLVDVAHELDPSGQMFNPSKNKGWIGNMTETVIAGKKDEVKATDQDLNVAGADIKAFGVGKAGLVYGAWEELRLRVLSYPELVERSFFESELFAKIRACVMVPYWRPPSDTIKGCRCQKGKARCRNLRCSCIDDCSCGPSCPCRGGDKKSKQWSECIYLTPFLWIPSKEIYESMITDWDVLAKRVRSGGKDPLSQKGQRKKVKLTSTLSAKTQGPNANDNWLSYAAADKKTYEAKGRSWYLQAHVVSEVCRQNMPGPWRAESWLKD